MFATIVLFLSGIVLFTGLIYLMARWSSNVLQNVLTARLRAFEELINENHLPEAWIKKYRRQWRKLEAGSPARARLKEKARKQVQRHMEELIRYTEGVNFTDTEETKQMMLQELREDRAAWAEPSPAWDAAWEEAMQGPFSPPEEREELEASE